ncbi:hypothetical protein D9M71_811320 [compost metagenome]
MAFGQAGQQGGLGGVDTLEGVSQLGGLGVAEGDGLVATFITQYGRDGGNQLGTRIDQWLCVEDFQPGALTVLGADTEGQAEQGSGHAVTSCEFE